jgi:signal peptidase
MVQDVVVAVIVVAVVLLSLWAYGGRWPPMVVVESESMQHSHDTSYVGVIDTGDLTLVRTLEKVGEVVTWVEGRDRGYETYSNYGDVIVYHKNGLTQTTPIIHRAIVRIVYNATGYGFDVPSLHYYNVKNNFRIDGLISFHAGVRDEIDLVVNVTAILNNFNANPAVQPHGGIITKGDHNRDIDQYSLPAWTGVGNPPPGVSRLVEPVEDGWLVGVARGEIPWFGIIKLWAKGQTEVHPPPSNSGYNLVISIVLLLVAPFLAESVVIEVRKLRPKRPVEQRRRTGKHRRGKGPEEEERVGPISFLVGTIRDALTGKVR